MMIEMEMKMLMKMKMKFQTILRAGQNPWSRATVVVGMPLCDEYQDYVMFMQRDNLIRTTRCFLPSNFMEYKVSEFDTFPLFVIVYCLQITEDPIVVCEADLEVLMLSVS